MVKSIRTLSRSAREKLVSHNWPGNVRELRNVIERAIDPGTEFRNPGDQPAGFSSRSPAASWSGPAHSQCRKSLDETMANFEKELISDLLEENHFSLTRTAEQLKISRHALRYRMQRLNIATDADAEEDPMAPAGKNPSS